MNDRNIIIGVVVLLIVVGVALFVFGGGGELGQDNLPTITASSSPIAQFAQCIKDSGAVYYGAFWCSHCKAQNALFGEAKALLPYVECSTPDGNGQKPICKDKNISGYPTWEFFDGSRLGGEQTFAQLGEKANCPVPVIQ
ncbi:MAG: hypothetical protein A2942_04570 [Candidatus Lloydbacteria bacterium RIFCSPLOWO2_01_FULL_50_20]|uniref:Thioredoxin domain-containing protein n=1 Tax=Candidatus Lloydbacteria bacterium RIFCSPLOWO2_01_FULL_50_20 TaxID=1798665 RepID=A0A1G2DJA2_9BACT|nr:MAG: hypothetical protein A3C13_02870 [Candidatus Lloydbacteria bacterium RIFCSPHIGHO2_02_FULL_50_11]OGZ13593.1 MAG: hypothetical protein A2942_04570 [Candidatus Lloydbacteria bacterium RIFCSPLOWO2_01_FULL_50_20]